jgi:hypothetical protein
MSAKKIVPKLHSTSSAWEWSINGNGFECTKRKKKLGRSTSNNFRGYVALSTFKMSKKCRLFNPNSEQGYQIGRIFAYWAICKLQK